MTNQVLHLQKFIQILYDNGTISDFELLYFEKDATKFSEIKINGFSLILMKKD